MSHPTTPQLCTNCGTLHNAATDVAGDALPTPGDWSICFNCGALRVFDGGGRLREPTAAELTGMELEERAQLFQAQQEILRRGRRH